MHVVASFVMDRGIAPGPATPGIQRRTRLESLLHRRAQEGKLRPKMVTAYIRALVAKPVTRQHITRAAIEMSSSSSGSL